MLSGYLVASPSVTFHAPSKPRREASGRRVIVRVVTYPLTFKPILTAWLPSCCATPTSDTLVTLEGRAIWPRRKSTFSGSTLPEALSVSIAIASSKRPWAIASA